MLTKKFLLAVATLLAWSSMFAADKVTVLSATDPNTKTEIAAATAAQQVAKPAALSAAATPSATPAIVAPANQAMTFPCGCESDENEADNKRYVVFFPGGYNPTLANVFKLTFARTQTSADLLSTLHAEGYQVQPDDLQMQTDRVTHNALSEANRNPAFNPLTLRPLPPQAQIGYLPSAGEFTNDVWIVFPEHFTKQKNADALAGKTKPTATIATASAAGKVTDSATTSVIALNTATATTASETASKPAAAPAAKAIIAKSRVNFGSGSFIEETE